MNIYTSYFGNWRRFKDLFSISIALYKCAGFKGITCSYLAPDEYYLSLKNNKEVYTKYFSDIILKKLDVETVYNKLGVLSRQKDIVLVCYEKPPKFCHRHIVADWFHDGLGIEVKEIDYM